MKVRNVLCLTTVFVLAGAMAVQAAQEGDLCQILQQGTVQESFLPNLSDKDLGRLAQTCKPMKAALQQELDRRQEQKAIWLGHVLNAGEVNCSAQRGVNRLRLHANNEAFKQYVIKSIIDFNIENPGRWIRLDLGHNRLGGDPVFLLELINAIVAQVQALNIDIAELLLPGNELTTLPDNIFNGLANLKVLKLNFNHLTTLPDNIFKDLANLQTLDLSGNQLKIKTKRELGLGDNVYVYW